MRNKSLTLQSVLSIVRVQTIRICSLVFIGSLATAAPALCQESASADPAAMQRYLAAVGGAANVDSNTTGTIAGEYGESIGRHAQAYANFTYFDNVMTQQMRDNLDAAADSIEQITGTSRSFSGRDRGLAFTVGGKFTIGTRVRPYVGGGFGGININRTITEATLGDVSLAFAAQPELGDGVMSAGFVSTTKPLGEIAAGIGFVNRYTYVDIGYRYRRAFHTPSTINFSQVTVGIGAKW